MSATSHLPAVGFIGLGDQGVPIARAIAEAGYPLHAWARRSESLETLSGAPYTLHRTGRRDELIPLPETFSKTVIYMGPTASRGTGSLVGHRFRPWGRLGASDRLGDKRWPRLGPGFGEPQVATEECLDAWIGAIPVINASAAAAGR